MGRGGRMLAWGIACALIETQRSSQGQVIDAAMCEAAPVLAHGLFNLESLGEWISVCPLEPQFYKTFVEHLNSRRGQRSGSFLNSTVNRRKGPKLKSRCCTDDSPGRR